MFNRLKVTASIVSDGFTFKCPGQEPKPLLLLHPKGAVFVEVFVLVDPVLTQDL